MGLTLSKPLHALGANRKVSGSQPRSVEEGAQGRGSTGGLHRGNSRHDRSHVVSWNTASLEPLGLPGFDDRARSESKGFVRKRFGRTPRREVREGGNFLQPNPDLGSPRSGRASASGDNRSPARAPRGRRAVGQLQSDFAPRSSADIDGCGPRGARFGRCRAGENVVGPRRPRGPRSARGRLPGLRNAHRVGRWAGAVSS
jgi:hypothetical protein